MYRGIEDPRFLLLPYDLDTILNSPDPNTSIWLAGRLNSLPVISRFLTHPVFVGRYYAQLTDLAETVFSPERVNPFVENTLGDWVPQATIESIETFVAARRRYVLSQIPVEFTAGSDLRPKARWRARYANSGLTKPGQINAGSGTTPTLLWPATATKKGSTAPALVAITDTAAPTPSLAPPPRSRPRAPTPPRRCASARRWPTC